jgi:hypothetical protein
MIRCSSGGGGSSSSSGGSSSSSVVASSISADDFSQFLPEPTRGGSAQISSIEDGVLTPASLASAATSAIGVVEMRQDEGQEELFGPDCQESQTSTTHPSP